MSLLPASARAAHSSTSLLDPWWSLRLVLVSTEIGTMTSSTGTQHNNPIPSRNRSARDTDARAFNADISREGGGGSGNLRSGNSGDNPTQLKILIPSCPGVQITPWCPASRETHKDREGHRERICRQVRQEFCDEYPQLICRLVSIRPKADRRPSLITMNT